MTIAKGSNPRTGMVPTTPLSRRDRGHHSAHIYIQDLYSSPTLFESTSIWRQIHPKRSPDLNHSHRQFPCQLSLKQQIQSHEKGPGAYRTCFHSHLFRRPSLAPGALSFKPLHNFILISAARAKPAALKTLFLREGKISKANEGRARPSGWLSGVTPALIPDPTLILRVVERVNESLHCGNHI